MEETTGDDVPERHGHAPKVVKVIKVRFGEPQYLLDLFENLRHDPSPKPFLLMTPHSHCLREMTESSLAFPLLGIST
jgi:hypothetical protein